MNQDDLIHLIAKSVLKPSGDLNCNLSNQLYSNNDVFIINLNGRITCLPFSNLLTAFSDELRQQLSSLYDDKVENIDLIFVVPQNLIGLLFNPNCIITYENVLISFRNLNQIVGSLMKHNCCNLPVYNGRFEFGNIWVDKQQLVLSLQQHIIELRYKQYQ